MRNPPKVLLLGGTGQIGSELRTILVTRADLVAPGRTQLDCASTKDVDDAIMSMRPDVVVNTAAYTRVDDAERDRDAALLLNAHLPETLARACERVGARLLHFSTDYVFPGDSLRPYREDDATGPINWYGETKLRGEQAVLAECSRAVILRTSWVYGRTGSNFFRTMLRLARERQQICVVSDQFGSPTWSRAAARAAASVLSRLETDDKAWEELRGVYHAAAGGVASWFEFATRLLSLDPDRGAHLTTELVAIGTADFPTRARRPSYSVLDCSLLAARMGVELPSWSAQLDAVWAS